MKWILIVKQKIWKIKEYIEKGDNNEKKFMRYYEIVIVKDGIFWMFCCNL